MSARIPSIHTRESCTVRRRPPQLDVRMSSCETESCGRSFDPPPLSITLHAMTLDKWVPFRNEGSVVRCRLFYFPHAAGNAAFYRPLWHFMPFLTADAH